MTRRMVGTIRTRGLAALLLCATLPFGSAARGDNSLSLDLNDDAARLTYARTLDNDTMRVDASWLHHQDNGNAASVGFHITGNAATESRPVNAGIGGRLYLVDAEDADADGQALAVGGFFEAKLPTYDRVGFGGHVYYAPDVLGFGDVDDLFDISARVTWSVLREGDVYLGVRNVKGDFGNRGEATLDTGLHIGFILNF